MHVLDLSYELTRTLALCSCP